MDKEYHIIGSDIKKGEFFKEFIELCKRYDVVVYPVVSNEGDNSSIRFSFRDSSYVMLDDAIDYECSNTFEKEYYDNEEDLKEQITISNS